MDILVVATTLNPIFFCPLSRHVPVSYLIMFTGYPGIYGPHATEAESTQAQANTGVYIQCMHGKYKGRVFNILWRWYVEHFDSAIDAVLCG